jgi:hypothetical protein
VRSLNNRTSCSSSLSMALRCSGMLKSLEACAIYGEESNPIHHHPRHKP